MSSPSEPVVRVPASRRPTRRAVTLGPLVAGVWLASGCDDGDGLDLPGLPLGDEDPDLALVGEALGHEQAVLDGLAEVRRRHRALRSALAPAVAVHQAHVDLLARTADDASLPRPPRWSLRRVPRDPDDVGSALAALERRLAQAHVTTAVRARSGVLARLVAAMSAAAEQQAVTLASVTGPRNPRRPDGDGRP